MIDQPKVLVACPTYDGKNYCIDEWMELIQNLSYTNYDILIVDNTNDKGKNAKWIAERFGVEVIHHFKKKLALNEVMAECNNIIRQRLIDGEYEYLMSIESDVFPPKDIIPRLINHQKLVVSGMYQIGVGEMRYPLIQVVDFGDEDGVGVVRQLHWGELLQFINRGVKRVHGCGIGCALIHHEVLKKYPFRTDPEYSTHADSFFYMDLWNDGLPVYLDTNLMCRHKNTDWETVYKNREKDFKKNFEMKNGEKWK